MTPILTQVLDKLENVRKSGDEYTAHCPAHEDKRNSLSIGIGDGGKILLHCHAGCAYSAIAARLGIGMSESKPPAHKRIVATYDYKDESGTLLYQAVRYDPKNFVQRRPANKKGEWDYHLNGTRRVLYHLPELIKAGGAQTVFVVEGEKDADNLARLGLLATTNVAGAGKWHDEYSESLRGRDVCIIPDNDDPGRKHAHQVAHSLNGIAKSIKILELPDLAKKGDVSDWISAGGDAPQLLALINAAPVFNANGNTKPAVDQSLEEHESPYLAQDGRTCRRKETQFGSVIVPLCNFTARIAEEVSRDDGADIERELTIEGKGANGRPFPPARVNAAQFGSMRWVTSSFGSRAIVEAGASAQDHLRAAIQYGSSDVIQRHIYTHTGWREVDGKMVYLTASGAIGGAPVNVELDKELERYSLPTHPSNTQEATRASLRFLEIAPKHVTVPIWAAMFLAPLAPIIPPHFILWLYGATGTMKSTISALALSHYGDFTQDDLVQWSATANALEKYLFLGKDAPFVVDDFAPQFDQTTARKLEDTAARIVRGVGNRSARARMKADLSLRAMYRPRGLVISTGEQLPDGQSLVARLVTVEIRKGDINLAKLSEAQDERELYRDVMGGYIAWLAGQWKHLETTLPALWRDLRTRARRDGQHLRVPESLASLYIGADMGLSYAIEVGAISEPDAAKLREECWQSLVGIAEQQAANVEEQRPTRRFLTVLTELIAQGRARLNSTDTPNERGESELVGWLDSEYVYLLPSASYHRVAQYSRDEGKHFGLKENALRKALAEEGILIADEGHYTIPVRIGGQSKRVLKLYRAQVEKISGVSLSPSG